MIKDEDKIDLDVLISDFTQMVNMESPDLSTDPNVKRVRVIKAEDGCGCSNPNCIEKSS
jgi:hypothetical protein